MNPQDLTVLRIVALYVQQLEAANIQLQAKVAEQDERIAELERTQNADPGTDIGPR